MADKCIGTLTLNTKKIDEAVKHVNEKLSELGAGIKVDISKQVASEVKKQLDGVLKEIQSYESKMSSAVDKAISNATSKAGSKIDNSVIKQATQDLQDYYKWLTMAEKARGSGDISGEDIYRKRADSIRAANTEMFKNAEATKAVTDAETRYQQALAKANEMVLQRQQKASDKAEAQVIKEKEQAVKEYIKALQEWYKAETDLNKELLSGNLQKGTEDYAAAREQIDQLASKAIDAGKKLTSLGVDANEATSGVRSLQQAAQALVESEDKLNTPKQEDYLAQIKQQYFEITDAVKNYNAAKKAGDSDGMANAQARIDAAMQEVNAIQEAVNASNLEATAKQQVLNYIQQCVTAEHQHGAEVNQTAQKTGELESQVNGLVTRYLSLMAVIRAISSLINNMVEYVSEYSDKMNEIQMITLKTDDEIADLAKTYRNLAADMSVSSLDMADAAIYFTRQGLAAEEIEKRLKNVTMYAKAANVEFEDASEIITAVVNSMGLVEQEAEDGRNAAQRVADVFLQIGDHAATSGQEIGEAMQKAAASAGAFGVSMEWLAAYIATVSETTRQEARTIGTAFNTIIARLHQIKATGYNQEDETKVNDIAKALSKIDVVLMDQEGNWRDMEDILVDVAGKWSELDGKTKSYIATTMAGVKQQNVFLALMNDMSKGADEGSRAFELYNMAMDSTGVAAEKYGVYLDTVTASQERLTVAQERFYSILNEDVIKGWNDALAGFINMLVDGTEAWGNWTIVVPVVIGVITAVAIAIKGLNAKLGETVTLMSMLEAHPVMMAISAAALVITGLVTIINAVASSIETTEEKLERINNTIADSQNRVLDFESKLNRFDSMMQDVGEDSKMTSEEIEKYNDLLNELSQISPIAADAVEDLKNNVGEQKEAYEKLNEEIQKYIQNEQLIQSIALSEKAGTKRSIGAGETFAAALLEHGSLASMGTQERFSIVEYELTDDIRSLIEDLVQREFSWEQIERIVSQKLLNGMSESDYLAQIANQLIDEYIETIGMSMNAVDKEAVRSQLASLVFGEDGILDFSEYKNMDNVLKNFIDQAILNQFDLQDMLGSEERIKRIGHYLFEDLFDMMFGDQLNEIMASGEADLFADKMSAAISELIDLGFNDIEIGDALHNIDLSDWVNAINAMKQRLLDEIKNNAGVENIGMSIVDLVTGETSYDTKMWDELDVSTLKYINDLILAGVQFDDIQMAMEASGGSSDVLKEKLANLAAELGITADSAEEAGKSLKDMIKDAKSGIKDIQAIDSAIDSVQESIKDGSNINYGDIFGLIELHPEIMTVIGDSEKLLAMLKKIREEAGKNQHESFKSMLLNEGKTSGTKFESSGFETLSEYRDSIEGDTEAIKEFDEEIDRLAGDLQLADENYKQMTKDEKEAVKEAKNLATEAAKAFKENLSEVETLDKVISKLQDNKKIDFSDIINLSSAHPEIVAFSNDADKLIEVLQRLKEEAKGTTKDSIKDILYDSEEYFKETEYYNPESNINTMREYITYLHESRGEWHDVAAEVDKAAQDIVDAADSSSSAAETWLEAQMKIAEINDQVNWAKANNFEEQISQLQEANERGGIQEAMQLYNSWDDKMQQAIGTTYPEFVSQFAKASKAIKEQGEETADLTERTEELGDALKTAQRLNEVKYFKDTAKAIKQLSEGTINATDAYEVYNKEVNKVSKAYEEIQKYHEKMAYNAKEVNKDNPKDITTNDVQDLANLLDMTAEQVLADFPAAEEMFNELTGSAGELQEVLQMLNKEAFIKITGVSDADFSKILEGLVYVEDEADKAVQKLLGTGQWELEARETHGWQDVLEGNQIVNKELNGKYWILKPSSGNPFSGRSSINSYKDTTPKNSSSGKRSGGGGSSGHNTKNTETEVEHALDIMSQVNAINQAQQNYYQSQQKYYSQTGQIQGVIAYMQKEKEELESQKPVLEGNIKAIERYMEQKRNELSALSTSDEAYAEVADDLDKLQKAHQNYTKQLIDNGTAIEALTEQMDEQRKKIRQMEIDLRNLILKAIEDRERKREDMMNAEIEMENTIFDLIKRRYEKERDHIIEVTNLKIQSLQEERDLLSEQLQLRKEQEEQEDKVLKLRELEAKYQRIVADPTRAKEAKSIRKEIDDLRKEMAWDAAEQEVKAQQDSIDQQITSLEDYSQYIQEYYEDLFEHPQKLIAETREIIMMTQEEILEWLKNNDEAYQNSSELTQQKIVNGWKNTYNEMKGILKLYWDEVEEIIAEGDEYIIQFLTENSADYAKAGKLQAEAYVDEWKKQLSDLKKAHEQVVANIAAEYEAIAKSTYVAPSGGGGSSGGGVVKEEETEHGYRFTFNGQEYSNTGYKHKGEATNAAKSRIYGLQSSFVNKGGNALTAQRYADLALATLYAYNKGGIADFTGPAWLDGSPQAPERILSPYQTELFETMVAALERSSKMYISGMPNYGDITSGGGNTISVGDIVVNVDNLDTDDDYEELAQKVSNILMERIGRTTVVGGMRINTI